MKNARSSEMLLRKSIAKGVWRPNEIPSKKWQEVARTDTGRTLRDPTLTVDWTAEAGDILRPAGYIGPHKRYGRGWGCLKRKEAGFGVSSAGRVLSVQAWGPELGSIKHIGFIWSLLLCSYFLMCVSTVPFVCILYIMWTPSVWVQKSTWHPLELEIKTVVSLQVGVRNWTMVSWKSCRSS